MDDPSEAIEAFLPGRFPFGKQEDRIVKYKKFLNKLQSKSQFQEFIKFVSDDTKDRKRYLYRNNRVYNDYDLFRSLDFKSESPKAKLHKIYGRNILVLDLLLEFFVFLFN